MDTNVINLQDKIFENEEDARTHACELLDKAKEAIECGELDPNSIALVAETKTGQIQVYHADMLVKDFVSLLDMAKMDVWLRTMGGMDGGHEPL